MQGVLQGEPAVQRRAMAKSITLLESTLPADRLQADELLTGLLPHSGKSFRLGISGVPGVGKSTFIEALGLFLIAQGHRVAVLAIDPSSTVSGGSILGDKTRMEHLSVHDKAFIRPSPSSGTLGGVAEKTREAMLVCEAAGYDVILVETVGVGQSEYQVAGMVDFFMVLMLPNAGDELQGIKKGIIELADALVINKADGESLNHAGLTQRHYIAAMSLPERAGDEVPEALRAFDRDTTKLRSSGRADRYGGILRGRRLGDPGPLLGAGTAWPVRRASSLNTFRTGFAPRPVM